MDKQKKWMDFQYHDNNGLSYAFFFLFLFFSQKVVVRDLEILEEKIEQVT